MRGVAVALSIFGCFVVLFQMAFIIRIAVLARRERLDRERTEFLDQKYKEKS